MSRSSERDPKRSSFRIKRLPTGVVSIVLAVLGIALLCFKSASWGWLDWHPLIFREIAPAFGEALIVAAILASFVDPFLKEKLLREASKGIFVHMIGFDHEPQLKERIKSIALETRLYQKDYRLTCSIEPFDSRVKMTMSKELEIFNQGLDKRTFRPGWRFTESDTPENCEIESTIGDEDIKTVQVLFENDGSGYHAAYGAAVEIEPQHKNKRYQFLARCTTIQPQDWYHAMYFEYPTIGIKFTIIAPDGWTVWIGGQQPQQKEAKFHTDKLYMPGEKIEIHWRKPVGIDPDC